ncbi:MAG: DUF2628 domain-containing protein [Nitrospirae bacterium]|nr:DUF2628 domain-containing protein [Nitrospirota bacterium]
MAYCRKCGKETAEGGSFCPHCGENLSSAENHAQQQGMRSAVTNDDFTAFVGKNSERYLPKFAKFNAGGIDNFRLTWHWPAFFAPFIWMLYRKLYGWALLAFIIGWAGLIPYAGIFINIAWATTANYIYFRHVKSKISEIKQQHSSQETQRAVIAEVGGVGGPALIIGLVIALIILLGIIAAISIPSFLGFKERAENSMTQKELTAACSMAQSIFMDDPNRIITLSDLKREGFMPSEEVALTIYDGSQRYLKINARHKDGGKKFTADSGCNITEEETL